MNSKEEILRSIGQVEKDLNNTVWHDVRSEELAIFATF